LLWVIPIDKKSLFLILALVQGILTSAVFCMDKERQPIDFELIEKGETYQLSIVDDTITYIPKKPNPPKQETLEYPYSLFESMRTLAPRPKRGIRIYDEETKETVATFRKQALFMKDFEDYCPVAVPLEINYTYHKYSTYESMNDAQLRTYFSWRTKARSGHILNTSLPYVYCYINELVNNIGVKSPSEAIDQLIAIWTAIRPYHNVIDDKMRVWIRDFYVEHKASLSIGFSGYSQLFPIPYHEVDDTLMAKAVSCAWDDLDIIELSSSYRITKSPFYKTGNQEMIEQCVCFIIHELAKVFISKRVDLRNLFFEKRIQKIYYLYGSSVHSKAKTPEKSVVLDDYETISCDKYGWYREYISISHYKRVVDYILKMIEVKMRIHFRYKDNLQEPNISLVVSNLKASEFEGQGTPKLSAIKLRRSWKSKALSILKRLSFEIAIDMAIIEFINQNQKTDLVFLIKRENLL